MMKSNQTSQTFATHGVATWWTQIYINTSVNVAAIS